MNLTARSLHNNSQYSYICITAESTATTLHIRHKYAEHVISLCSRNTALISALQTPNFSTSHFRKRELPQCRRSCVWTQHQVHVIRHILEWRTDFRKRKSVGRTIMSGTVSNDQSIWGSSWPANVGEWVGRMAARQAHIFDRNWHGAVGNYAVGCDRSLASIPGRPWSSFPEDVAAEQTPEQDHVDDIHNDNGRRDGDQIWPTHATAPEDHSVPDPDEADEPAADEGEEICSGVQAVQQTVEGHAGHLEQLSEV